MNQRIGQIAILAAILLALAGIGGFGMPWAIRAGIEIFALIFAADALAHRWNRLPRVDAYVWGVLVAFAGFMIARTIWFYAGLNLNGWGDVVPLMVVVLAAGVYRLVSCELRVEPAPNEASGSCESEKPTRNSQLATRNLIFPALSLIGLALVAYGAHRAATTATIRTPWPLLPDWTLPIIGLLFAIPAVSAVRRANRWIIVLESACAIGAVAAIAPLVYAIGFGFDGFLHVAGERVLLDTGVLVPKPMYYVGQYVATTWIAKLTELDIGAIDRWLVPAASALLIPFALAASGGCSVVRLFGRSDSSNPNNRTTEQPNNRTVSLASSIFLLPLGFFVATTPNGFAMVLALVALIAAIGAMRGATPWTIPFVFAAWSALTHPLIGLPVFTAVFAAFLYGPKGDEPADEQKIERLSDLSFVPPPETPRPAVKPLSRRSPLRIVSVLIAVLSGFTVPIVFGLSSAIGSQGTTFAIGKLADLSAWAGLASAWIPWVANHFSLWADASVWIERIVPLLAAILAIIGVIRAKRAGEGAGAAIFLVSAASAAAAAIILQLAGDFGFLIDYERGNYAARLWSVAFILLLPAALPTLSAWIGRLARASLASSLASIAAIGLIGAGSAYAALPRHDAVTPSRGWSVSRSDINAVKLIDEDSGGAPYTVLANQSVSAAAVRTFGFKRYNGDTFFYPIPTGGKLYDIFLTASYGDPSRDTMQKAAELGGSKLVYFAVNDYWWKSDELIENASSSTDRTFVIDDGKVTVFKYQF